MFTLGDVLAQIDPAPLQAALLEQAKAKKGQHLRRMIANAQVDMKREVDLFAAKVDSQQVYDTQKVARGSIGRRRAGRPGRD